jgi:glycosyltransferase involved in cell wall biosynthesis
VFELLEIAYNLYAMARLRRLLRSGSEVVFYERYAFFLSLSTWLARRRGVPVVLEVNEVAGVARARGLVMEGLARRIERATFGRADAVLAVSSFLADEARRRGARDGRVHVIPNAVAEVGVGSRLGRETREILGVGDRIVIGFVGWFDRWDRLDLLVEVFAELHGARPETHLLLVGDGPVAAELRAEVASRRLQSAVTITGAVPRDEVPRYLAAMDIGVLPSSNDFGSPIALFELMAAGKPVVAPDVAPIRDVVEDGVTGIVVPRGDRDALARVLGRLVNDAPLRNRLGAAAMQRVAAEHTWAANARRIASIAAACVGRAR